MKLLSISYEAPAGGAECPKIALKIDWEMVGQAAIAMKLFLTQNGSVYYFCQPNVRPKRNINSAEGEISAKLGHNSPT